MSDHEEKGKRGVHHSTRIVEGEDTALHDEEKYRSFFLRIQQVDPDSRFFLHIAKGTMAVAYRYLRRRFKNLSKSFSFRVLAFLVETDKRAFLLKRFREIDVVTCARPELHDRLALMVTVISQTHFLDIPQYSGLRETLQVVSSSIYPSFRCPTIDAVTGARTVKMMPVSLSIMLQNAQGLIFDERTIEAMEYCLRYSNLIQTNFLDHFLSRYRPSDLFAGIVVATLTTANGSIVVQPILDRFEGRPMSPIVADHCLLHAVVFGLLSQVADEVELPHCVMNGEILLDVAFVLVTLHDEVNEAQHWDLEGPVNITYHEMLFKLVEACDLTNRPLSFQLEMVVDCLKIMDYNEPNSLPESIYNNEPLLNAVMEHVFAIMDTELINLYIVVLWMCNTKESTVVRRRVLKRYILDTRLYMCSLHRYLSDDVEMLEGLWRHLLEIGASYNCFERFDRMASGAMMENIEFGVTVQEHFFALGRSKLPQATSSVVCCTNGEIVAYGERVEPSV
jgi:hypothetical protein